MAIVAIMISQKALGKLFYGNTQPYWFQWTFKVPGGSLSRIASMNIGHQHEREFLDWYTKCDKSGVTPLLILAEDEGVPQTRHMHPIPRPKGHFTTSNVDSLIRGTHTGNDLFVDETPCYYGFLEENNKHRMKLTRLLIRRPEKRILTAFSALRQGDNLSHTTLDKVYWYEYAEALSKWINNPENVTGAVNEEEGWSRFLSWSDKKLKVDDFDFNNPMKVEQGKGIFIPLKQFRYAGIVIKDGQIGVSGLLPSGPAPEHWQFDYSGVIFKKAKSILEFAETRR